jgi:hypothetical protein
MKSSDAPVVKIARNLAELEPYRSFFDAHHRHAACNLDTLVDERGKEWVARPHVMILCRDSEPAAMVVGRLGPELLQWHIGYKRIGASKARLFRTVTGGILGDLSRPEDCDLLCEAMLGFLRSGEADVAQIGGVRADSRLLTSMEQRPALLSRDHFVEVVPHWRLSLPDSYDEFYKTRSSNTKSNIRQYKNRITKRFGKSLRLERYQSGADLDGLMIEIEGVAAKTYQRGIGVGFSNTPAVRRKWQYAAEHGLFVAYVLYLEGKPSAFWTGTIYKGTFMSEYTGFDPELSYYHPGMFVLVRMIEDFCAEHSVQIIDFGTGDADYKRKFGSETIPEATLHVFAPTLTGARLSLVRNGTMLVSHSARRALGALGVTSRLKSFWRKRLASKDTAAAPAPAEDRSP